LRASDRGRFFPPDQSLNQTWIIVLKQTGESGVQIVSLASGEYPDLPYGAVASIETLQQYYCGTKDPAQGWAIDRIAKEKYSPGYSLDTP
jgi:hypothetical protein